MKTVTLYFTRHAQSLSNQLAPTLGTTADFTDCGLSPDGLDDVVYWRNKKITSIGQCDYIFTSPLKRCLQTALMTYNKTLLQTPIYVMSVLTEFDKYPDCDGRPIDIIQKDLDLIAYKNYDNLDFNKYFMEYNTHESNWSALEFRYKLHERIENICEFFCRPEFYGKKIHIFSHSGVIGNLCKTGVVNYQTVKVILNQETGELIKCEYLP